MSALLPCFRHKLLLLLLLLTPFCLCADPPHEPVLTEAKTVILAGSFNQWNEHADQMHRTASGWGIELPPGTGKHTYKFIVDGQWMTDPANPRRETAWDGHVNSVLLVR